MWNLGYVKDVKALESVQRRWTKCVDGLENLSYFDHFKALNLFSVKGLIRCTQYWPLEFPPLPESVVTCPSLESFKIVLASHLGNLLHEYYD